MTLKSKDRAAAIRVVIPFVLRHWFRQPGRAATVAVGLLGATVADLFMPLFSGQLVDAVTKGGADPAARQAAFVAFGAIVALGATSMLLRLLGIHAIVPFTLRIMSDLSREAFARVQRFSTDWHANSFAGSTVRKVTRGMWAACDPCLTGKLATTGPLRSGLLSGVPILVMPWPPREVVRYS